MESSSHRKIGLTAVCGCRGAETLVFLLLAGCGEYRSTSVSTDSVARQPSLVNVIRVAAVENSLKTEVCFGKLKPNRLNRLSFARPGRVKAVLKQVGDRCAEGETLATIAVPQLDEQKAMLETDLARAKRNPQAAAQVAAIEAQLKAIEVQLVAAVIVAPYNGIVIECNVDEGSMTSPALTAFVVAEDSLPYIEATLPQHVASQLVPNQKLWAGIGGKAVVSKVTKVTPAGDSSNSRQLRLEFVDDLSSGTWAFGEVVEVRFYLQTGRSGFWLPISALQRLPDGRWAVDAVVVGDRQVIERRAVDVTQLEDEFALVSEGFVEGDQVVANGGHRIVAGQTVSTIDVSNSFSQPFGAGSAE